MNQTKILMLAATVAVLAIVAVGAVYAQTVSSTPTPAQSGYSTLHPAGAYGDFGYGGVCPRMYRANGYGYGMGMRGGMMGGYYP